MKGIKVDAKTKKVEYVEDGLPMPQYPISLEPEGLDLATTKELLDNLKARVEKLEKK